MARAKSYNQFVNENLKKMPKLKLHPSQIDVENIEPDAKDIMRADNMNYDRGFSYNGEGVPFYKLARVQAEAIDDPNKMVRRAKAVGRRWGLKTPHIAKNQDWNTSNGNTMFTPFERGMKRLGFTPQQIEAVKGAALQEYFVEETITDLY